MGCGTVCEAPEECVVKNLSSSTSFQSISLHTNPIQFTPPPSFHLLRYAVVALLVEVNSIFLHMRQLQVVQGWSRHTSTYRLIALCNVATFLVFR